MAKTKKETTTGFSDELKEALKAINSSYGQGSIMMIDESPNVTVERISSGSLILDRALSGGYVKGAIIELFGETSIGKSTLALHFLAQFVGKPVLYLDFEQSLDMDYAAALGVDLSQMLIMQPSSIEDGLSVMQDLCDKVEGIVFDSVAEAATKREVEGDLESQDIGVKARLMSKALRKLKATPHESTILFINQVRLSPGDIYNPRTTPGGLGLRYAAHIRVDLNGKEWIKKGSGETAEIIGHRAKAKCVKNKAGRPHMKCEIPILYNGLGVSREQEIIDLGLEAGLIIQSGSWFSTKDGLKLGQGSDNVRLFLMDNKELCLDLEAKLKAIV